MNTWYVLALGVSGQSSVKPVVPLERDDDAATNDTSPTWLGVAAAAAGCTAESTIAGSRRAPTRTETVLRMGEL